jgi:ketosteroid isomerase-like protein
MDLMKPRHSVVLAACLVLSLFLPSSAGGKPPKNPADAVRAADEEWMKVFAAKDLDKSVAFCEGNGAVLPPNAPIAQGRQAIAKSLAGFFAFPNLKITWHADQADVARSGELGYTRGTYQMSFTDAGGKTIPDNGKYVTVWRKQADGSWKVVLDIFNTDLPGPGAS